MGKGFKLPGKLPGAPAKIAMPAIQSGGSYRNPAMVIDRSAEILGAGIQSGMDKIGEGLKKRAMDKMAEEKGEEPQSNLDKEIQNEKLESTAVDASTKLDAFKSTTVPALDSQAEEFLTKFRPGVLTNRNAMPAMIDDELAAVGTPVDLPETPLQMKNDSPNKFLGGAMSAAFGGGPGDVNNSGLSQQQMQNAIAPGGKFVGIGNVGKAISQAQQGTAASAAAGLAMGAGGTMGTPDQNPMTGGAGGGQTLNCTPVAMSYDPPLQANEKGGKTPVFNLATQGMAETAFGTPAMRQASVGSAFQVSAAQEAAFGPDSDLAEENPAKAKKIYDGIKDNK